MVALQSTTCYVLCLQFHLMHHLFVSQLIGPNVHRQLRMTTTPKSSQPHENSRAFVKSKQNRTRAVRFDQTSCFLIGLGRRILHPSQTVHSLRIASSCAVFVYNTYVRQSVRFHASRALNDAILEKRQPSSRSVAKTTLANRRPLLIKYAQDRFCVVRASVSIVGFTREYSVCLRLENEIPAHTRIQIACVRLFGARTSCVARSLQTVEVRGLVLSAP